MQIKICTTLEWSEKDWNTYVSGFNEVFEKDFSVEYFKHKYLSVTGGYTYHSLLYNDHGDVVGGCSVIPCIYNRRKNVFLNGLVVDVFIREIYRIDPLMLRRMYNELKKRLKEKGMVAVMAVPNSTAYPYWKNVVKWKEIGKLDYWMLPVRLGNILKKCRGLNTFSILCVYCYYYFSVIFSWFNSKAGDYVYSLEKQDQFSLHRYDNDYVVYNRNGIFFAYRIVDEEGVKTAYLINAVQNDKRSVKAFRLALKDMLRQDIDLILYVGKMGFPQTLFIKVPEKLEPKRLPLMFDLISDDPLYKDMCNINLWDFGLMNYDVR